MVDIQNQVLKNLKNYAKKKKIILIEDAAQTLGSFYPDGRHIGTVGLAGSFSFSTSKIISTGQGGAVVTNNDKIANKIRKLKDFGRAKGGNDIHDEIGFNFKFTDLQACIGIEQMKKLPWRVNRKKEIFKRYKKKLKKISQISFFDHELNNTAPWFIDVLVEDREELQVFLKQKNIGTRVMYPPIHKQKAYKLKEKHPVSENIGKKGLWLPSSVQISNHDIDYISNTMIEFYTQ